MTRIARPARASIALASLLGPANCTNYTPPPSVDAANAATLNGSRAPIAAVSGAPMIRAEPAGIDGSRIFNNAFTPDRSVLVAPGSHVIRVFIGRFDFPPLLVFGTVTANFEAGKTYTLHATNFFPSVEPDGQASGTPNETKMWIETGGVPITDKVAVFLPPPQSVEVPVFIPIR